MQRRRKLKWSPVALRRLSFGAPEPWLLLRLQELNGQSLEPFATRCIGGSKKADAIQAGQAATHGTKVP